MLSNHKLWCHSSAKVLSTAYWPVLIHAALSNFQQISYMAQTGMYERLQRSYNYYLLEVAKRLHVLENLPPRTVLTHTCPLFSI